VTRPSAAEPYIVALRGRLQRFPERREAAKRVDTLKQQLLLITTLEDQSANVRRQREHLASVFPGADMTASARQLQIIQVKAHALLRLITASAAVPDVDMQQAVAELRRAVQGASSVAEREWSEQVEAVVSKYERLSQALQRAGVRGSAELLATVSRIRAIVKPPKSLEEVRRASEDIASVGPTLARLGLEGGLGGKIGGFLTAAAEGRGSATSLLEPDVRLFLDTHDLWSVLAVSFR
jgi:hypothetical protein